MENIKDSDEIKYYTNIELKRAKNSKPWVYGQSYSANMFRGTDSATQFVHHFGGDMRLQEAMGMGTFSLVLLTSRAMGNKDGMDSEDKGGKSGVAGDGVKGNFHGEVRYVVSMGAGVSSWSVRETSSSSDMII
ncbi:hypothetical protein LIER_27347 [Lithospermum erythrorhizon]|uniref:Uncharacterized protein n=1 Tax=Lithospermum erythrorhizon TaxID=34254 RepID=A0AAV3RFM0_LITER